MADQTPKRIQRRRTKGWRLPPDAIYVGRPSLWGNPWSLMDLVRAHSVQPDGSAWTVDDIVRWFRSYAIDCGPAWIQPLRGHDLACWCPLVDENGNAVHCHADVLLELANAHG